MSSLISLKVFLQTQGSVANAHCLCWSQCFSILFLFQTRPTCRPAFPHENRSSQQLCLFRESRSRMYCFQSVYGRDKIITVNEAGLHTHTHPVIDTQTQLQQHTRKQNKTNKTNKTTNKKHHTGIELAADQHNRSSLFNALQRGSRLHKKPPGM